MLCAPIAVAVPMGVDVQEGLEARGVEVFEWVKKRIRGFSKFLRLSIEGFMEEAVVLFHKIEER